MENTQYDVREIFMPGSAHEERLKELISEYLKSVETQLALNGE